MTFDDLSLGTVQSNASADAFYSPMPFLSYEGDQMLEPGGAAVLFPRLQ